MVCVFGIDRERPRENMRERGCVSVSERVRDILRERLCVCVCVRVCVCV